MRVLTPLLAAATAPGAVGTLATVWILTRLDGTVIGFTDHDRPLTLQGITCAPQTGLSPGAARAELGPRPGEAQMQGLLDAEAVTEADIAAGLYDRASLAAWRVDWTAPEASALILWRGKIAALERTGSGYVAHVAGPLGALGLVTGRTYRADHDATHSPMFHQCEGLVIDRGITLGHLKGCLIDFLRTFFAISDLPVRFRSSYFPFTEPSMEVDIGWNRKTGELGRGGDWLEILGSGMVHPRVLANCGIDPREWQGFAFGMGVERITMLKHGMADLRPFYESDVRWLKHYGFNPLSPTMLHEGL